MERTALIITLRVACLHLRGWQFLRKLWWWWHERNAYSSTSRYALTVPAAAGRPSSENHHRPGEASVPCEASTREERTTCVSFRAELPACRSGLNRFDSIDSLARVNVNEAASASVPVPVRATCHGAAQVGLARASRAATTGGPSVLSKRFEHGRQSASHVSFRSAAAKCRGPYFSH